MIVRTLEELEVLGRVKYPADRSFRSARFLTAADGMGFSYNENKVAGGTNLVVWLKHHWEANYIVSGRGQVADLTSNESWPLAAGVLYVVGPNDRHRLHLTEDECHISIFRPPLTGDERFDEDGCYEASGPIEKTDRRMFVKSVDEMRRAGAEQVTADGRVRTVEMLGDADRIGFGVSDLRLVAGAETMLGDSNSCQANHVLFGTGVATDIASGDTRKLGSGMAFFAGAGDELRVQARTDMHILSVFSQQPAGAG
ncbi:MAG: ectoine synthase [Pseudomonadota bacterium]